ncbi:hypothetical protein ACTWPT_19115 [Nonomuraea sp. 3N208]|uniref:hypothetical protein n=1 Tax=Nonomuraea sp. 3N208 TaxID=3457421 RepID=UPI003FCC63C7
MSEAHGPSGTAVFVDQSGRRRRVLVIAGVLLGTLMLAMAAVLIGGAFSTTRLDAVDWPEGGNGAPEKSVPAATTSSPTPSQTPRLIRSVTPTAQASPTPQRTSTPTPTRTRTGIVRPSASSSATPTSEATTSAPATADPTATETERTPPGQTRQPPGLDKTQGPKR